MSSKEEIDNTFFFFAHTIPENLRKHFHNSAYLPIKESRIYQNPFLLAPYMIFKRRISWPFLFHAEIFGLDFFWYLLRGLKFNYIEDCPNVLDIWETSSLYQNYLNATNSPLIKKWLRKLLFGEYYCFPVGTSKSVKAIYASSPNDKSYHKGKEHYVIDLKDLWDKSSTEKKNFIQGIYNISEEDFALLRSSSVIILTQPLCYDGIMSQDEQISIYRSMIEYYGAENIIIKPHPRDVTNYPEIFPNVKYLSKPIPMQILSLWGVNFEKVVTVNSSSALSFGKDADIDWWAEKMDFPRITDAGVKTLEEAKDLISSTK
jgi:hypothetical protein